MSRPLRIEFSGAFYHITSRGNGGQSIYNDDTDRQIFLDCFSKTIKRYNWLCHAYCLMDNHYHFLIETQSPTLSKGMKHLNGHYTQTYNRRHDRVGHLFQGRYKSILIEKDSYLLELSRYIVLNPVRAHMVARAGEWPWSSYRATAGLSERPSYLTSDFILGVFSEIQIQAQDAYCKFVEEGHGASNVWNKLKHQIYLGSDHFIKEVQGYLEVDQSLDDIPKQQKQTPAKPLSYFKEKYTSRNNSMSEAYRSGHFTLKEIGGYFDVSIATVSRALKECDV